jgi:hypothetical protein
VSIIKAHPRPLLVGLTGLARSGKDTVACRLREAHGFDSDSFAGPIRECVARVLNVDPAKLEEIKESPIPWLGHVTPRRMMQTLGTEWGREMIHPAMWVLSCMRRTGVRQRHGYSVVISDVRFDNEAEAIRAAGGVVWRVVRASAGISGGHVSEAGVRNDLIDRVIPNNSSFEMLYAAVDANVAALS